MSLYSELLAIFQSLIIKCRVNPNDSLIEIGFNSLKAIELEWKVFELTGIEIGFEQIFQKLTVDDVINIIIEKINMKNMPAKSLNTIKKLHSELYYATSSAQKRMYTLDRFETDSTSYNMPLFRVLYGALDVCKLKVAFIELIYRHESLRTSFGLIDEEVVQYIHDTVEFEINVTKATDDEAVKLACVFIQPFNLCKAPLIRVELIQISIDKHILMVDTHHIISDGISSALLWREFTELYNGYTLPEQKIHYKDFAAWQNGILQSEIGESQKDYWLDVFIGELPVLELQTDYVRPQVKSFDGDNVIFKVDKNVFNNLTTVMEETCTTLYMVLLSAYVVQLSKYTGQEDIIVGSPVAGRRHADLNGVAGMFVNTVAMRNYPQGFKTYREFLYEVKSSSLKAYENQDYPFEELVEKLNIKRDMSRNPLFDTMFVLQNMRTMEFKIAGIDVERYRDDLTRASKFDITLSAYELEDGINCSFEYCTKLFSRNTIECMKSHFLRVLECIVENPDVRLSDIDILTVAEREQVLFTFNDTATDYPKDKMIHQIFEEQAKNSPDNIALVFDNDTMTYCELNEKSNKLARALRKKGVKPDDLVSVFINRSFEMIIGILGIMKAGGAYVPIDPEYPDERIKFMLDDSESNILLTQSWLVNIVRSYDVDVLCLDNEECYAEDGSNLEFVNKSSDLAYCIYTSGSTGIPKGVLIEHTSVINLLCNQAKNSYSIESNENVLQFFQYTFDASVEQIFVALLTGATLSIANKDIIQDMNVLSKYIKNNHITHIHMTPSSLNSLVLYDYESIKRITVGGEMCTWELVKKHYGNCDFFNEYGPTEATISATIYKVDNLDFEQQTLPIGKPIANYKVYILDVNKQPQPIGVVGELCISGVGLARGYLNRPELTVEKFVDNPFVPGERMYRTGDLAKWLPDGNIEFIGRIDDQVKVRGYRIELGEVESALLKNEKISEAVVLAKDDTDGTKCLSAFIVVNENLTIPDLKNHLGTMLPDYMIPSYFTQVEKIPLTSNGKVDRSALLSIETQIITGVSYEAPSNETEEQLYEIWKKLLHLDNVSTNDNFFDLGGQSLKAVILVSKISQFFNVELNLSEVFMYPTIKGLAEQISKSTQTDYTPIMQLSKQPFYEASSAQKRMYTLDRFEPDNTNYNMPLIRVLNGELVIDSIKMAFKKLVQRHESLRTSFGLVDEEIVQYVHDDIDFDIPVIEAVGSEADMLVKAFVRSFDLSKAPLIRAGLIQISNNKHILMTDTHHIINDGVSSGVLWQDITNLYNGKTLSDQKIQYKDFAAWQNEYLLSEPGKQQEKYWLDVFSGELPVLELQTDYVRPAIQSFEGDNVGFKVDCDVHEKLKILLRETGSTLYMALLAVYSVMLSKHTGQDDIIVGSPIAGRRHDDLSGVVGMFVNTLAMRNYPESEKTFHEFLNEVKSNALKALENQDYQFEELVEKLNIKRDMSRNPLFASMFVLNNAGSESYELSGIANERYRGIYNTISKFDLTLSAYEIDNGIHFNFEYCTKLFRRDTIERMANHFVRVLETVVDNPDILLSNIEMLTITEREQILYKFNDTAADYLKDKTIHQIFEEQVKSTPDNIALVFDGNTMPYCELNEKSNRLARTLRKKGVKPDDLVGMFIERSFDMIIGILGILKSGGAYVPIGLEYPDERIKFMLDDSGAKALLTQSWLADKVRGFDVDVLCLDNEDCYTDDSSNLEFVNKSSDLAYCIYTSGSTGIPKGVLIEHKSVVNLLYDMEKQYPVNCDDSYLLKTSYTFDVSVTELFGWFFGKGKVIILKQGSEKSPSEIVDIIKMFDVTHINFVPSMLPAFFDVLESNDTLNNLKYLFSAGEALSLSIVNQFRLKLNNVMLENIYGPTEATIYALSKSVDSDITDAISIGKALRNYSVYILSSSDTPQPIGIVGELCISGVGLARGYLNRPELTAEKFVENPFIPGERMYRTGDLAKWLPDGNIEFIGRMDDQVKVRGYRIELGEIENALLKNEQISEAVVLAKDDSDSTKCLVAYLVADKELTISDLRNYLGATLPEYMIPSYFVQLDALPLTSNGKVNRKTLLAIETRMETGATYEAPSNEVEAQLANIWEELLHLDKVSVNDNLFDLGGQSLKAIVLVSRVNQVLEVELTLSDIFLHPTVKRLAVKIKNSVQAIYTPIIQLPKRSYYETSSAQKRMYTLDKFESGSTNYNMPFVRVLTGKLDAEKLRLAFAELVQRHESLRTSFGLVSEEIIQYVHEEVEFGIHLTEATDTEADALVKSFVRPFDLNKAPLIRVELLQLSKNEHILMMDTHHIINDGISSSILWQDITNLYNGKTLSEQKIQYKDFAAWQNEYLLSELGKQQEEYWLDVFSGELPFLELQTDYTRPVKQSFEGDNVGFNVDFDVYEKLKILQRETGSTLYMALLTVYNIMLSKYTGQEDIIVGSPIAGRRHNELNGVVGMFVNTLAMRSYPQGLKKFKEFLYEVKRNALKAYENQDYQFEELVEKLNIKRDMSRNPLFDTMFALNNVGGERYELSGIKNERYQGENSAVSKFDLTLSAYETDNGIHFNIEYCTKLFKRDTIERMSGHFVRILETVVDNPDIKLSDIDILTDTEREQILYTFNNTVTDYPKDKMIHQIFEEQVKNSPDNIALVFDSNTMTYHELNEKSNRLARTLRKKGVKPDDLVGMFVERSFDMIIGILGIMKSGGAYVPIDPEYPDERIEFMLDDSGAKVLLTQSWLAYRVRNYGNDVLCLDDEDCYAKDSSNLEFVNKSSDLAYCIYTSGSTGIPKGVLIEHKSVVNLGMSQIKKYKINSNENILQSSQQTFDPSVEQMILALFSGATLYLMDNEQVKDTKHLGAYIEEMKITHFNSVPSHINSLGFKANNKLKRILAGGDICSIDLVKKQTGKHDFFNAYGPTEATVTATVYQANAETPLLKTVPVGRPIDNAQAYIMNDKQLCGIGIVGELCIAGAGLARGYLNRPELTAEKFVENPFIPGDRMYRTGDSAKWLPDGNIEFIGRIDDQVKIRGYRIELGEVENALLKNEQINEAVVLAIDDIDGTKYLSAYIATDNEFTIPDLRSYLGTMLPGYMIPSYFTQLEKLPINSNGKVDRKALHDIEKRIETGATYEAPTNEDEERLCEIWKELLHLDKVSINDNFFDLGGQSLKAVVLVSKVTQAFEVELSLSEVFMYPTIKGMVERIIESTKIIYTPIMQLSKQSYYETSSAQKRMYTLDMFDPGNINYNMPNIIILNGELDINNLKMAFIKLVQRHESLRTSFGLLGEEIVQYIHDEVGFDIPVTEAFDYEADVLVKAFIRSFNLSKAPLIRVELIRISNERHILMIDTHHIINDGVSSGILWQDITNLYSGKSLSEQKMQYKDFAAWQNEYLLSEPGKQQEEYWLDVFSGELPILELQTDYTRPVIQSFEGDNVGFSVDYDVYGKMKTLLRNTGSTLYIALLAVYDVMLSKYTGQEDIIVGSPIAGRRHGDLSSIVGMFVNTLAMRNYPKGSKKFKEFLDEVKTNSLKAYENQDYQFEELVEKLNIKRDMSRNPLFDTMFVLNNVGSESYELPGILNERYRGKFGTVSKFDLTLSAYETDTGIHFNIEYCTNLFKRDTIERMSGHFVKILETVTDNPDILLSDINMLANKECEQVLFEFNSTVADYPKDKTIHQIFEEQVKNTPDNIALVFDSSNMNYYELNKKANRLARTLRTMGVKPDDLVGVLVDRSMEMIVGILGILKSGGAYVPIDPEYPYERIKFMLDDSDVKVLLTQSWLADKTQSYDVNVLCLDNEDCYAEDGSNLEFVNRSNDLAYCIFTSGSTGVPKGVLIEHVSVINLITEQTNVYKITEIDRILQFYSISFDPSVWLMQLALLNGAALYIIQNNLLLDPIMFTNYLINEDITLLSVVPSFYKKLDLKNVKSLSRVILGGEVCSVDSIHMLRKETELFNVYGPTEATVVSSSYMLNRKNLSSNVPIGKPIANYMMYILNSFSNPQPIGVIGELYISGVGLARGYLNRPELTAEKFVDNPYVIGERMYRTGDLAKWLPDGNIEFVGRIDDQVKIRGYRIELGEIEVELLKNEYINAAVALVKSDVNGENSICAYIVADKELTISEVRNYLGKKLPGYMVPSHFTQHTNLPLTPNGKIDRIALMGMDTQMSSGVEYEAPVNETEEKITDIWKTLLHIDKVSVNDDFFDLGGQSLKAVILVSQINQIFNVKMTLSDVFIHPTIRGMSEIIMNYSTSDYSIESNIVKLSDGKEGCIFAFPPAFGYGVAYKELGNILSNYALYGLNYIKDGVIQEYVELIKKKQYRGPYILLAYSAGGKLAYEVARRLEKTNDEVNLLILIDSDLELEYNEYEFIRTAHFYMAEKYTPDSSDELSKLVSEIIDKNLNYVKLLNEIKVSKPINAQIALILSEDSDSNRGNYLDEITFSKTMTLKGYGSHLDMISGSDVIKNANLIRDIIAESTNDKNTDISKRVE